MCATKIFFLVRKSLLSEINEEVAITRTPCMETHFGLDIGNEVEIARKSETLS